MSAMNQIIYDIAQAGYFEHGELPDKVAAEFADKLRAKVEAEIVAFLRVRSEEAKIGDWDQALGIGYAADMIERGEHRQS
jgi:hypothetical protein